MFSFAAWQHVIGGTTNPSFWHRLGEKSVDIAAHTAEHVISAILIGLVALATWKAKTWLDLRKEAKSQLQQAAIDEELTKQRSSEARQQQVARLKWQLAALVEQASKAHDSSAGSNVIVAYIKWLEETRLIMWRGNLSLFNRWQANPWLKEPELRSLEADIRSTEIPTANDSDFFWS